MTDVFISYSREDRDRVRPIVEALQHEGWDVWWDPSIPLRGQNDIVDSKLEAAGVVLTVWSHGSRKSEYVRSEATAGLTKNKLVQISIDPVAMMAPFNQVAVNDLSFWAGDHEDLKWRLVVSAVKLYAGEPGARIIQDKAAKKLGKKTYLERGRTLGPAAWALLAAMPIAAGGWALYAYDPFRWFAPAPHVVMETTPSPVAIVAALPTPDLKPSPPEVQAAWEAVDKVSAPALRGFLAAYPDVMEASSARTLLGVQDANAWAIAVKADTESAYTKYLAEFGQSQSPPGEMVTDALARRAALTTDRGRVIEALQGELIVMGLYDGPGKGGDYRGTQAALKAYADRAGIKAPAIATASVQKLRELVDTMAADRNARVEALIRSN